MNTNELLNETGLNWTVRKESVQTESGIIIPDKMAVIREDKNIVLGVMGEGYQPYQNHELFDLLERVSNSTGLELKKGGMFDDGAKVYIQLKSNDLKLGDDKIEGFLTGINSFDGSTSLSFGPSNITISCRNTFFAAFRGLKTKIRHTTNMGIRIEDVLKSLELTLVEEKHIFDNIIKLSETRIGEGTIDDVLHRLFDIDKNINLQDDSISTNKRNKMSKFYVDLNGEIKEKGDNLWGIFSGVTRFTSHSLSKDSDSNLKNKMIGVYGERERSIFNHLVELV